MALGQYLLSIEWTQVQPSFCAPPFLPSHVSTAPPRLRRDNRLPKDIPLLLLDVQALSVSFPVHLFDMCTNRIVLYLYVTFTPSSVLQIFVKMLMHVDYLFILPIVGLCVNS